MNSSELLSFKDENQPPGDQEPNQLHSIKGFRHSNNINNVVRFRIIYLKSFREYFTNIGTLIRSIDALVELMELELEIRTANSGVFVGGSVSGVGFLTFSHLVESQKSGNSMNISITGEPFALSICY